MSLKDDIMRIAVGTATIVVSNLSDMEILMRIVASALGSVVCLIAIATGWIKLRKTWRHRND